MKTMISMLLSMLKVGFVGFGGGNAIIPLVEKEIVTTKKMMSVDEFNKYVVLCNITPGTFTVKLASALGEHICGLWGMILAPLMMALPGVLLTVLFISLLSQFSGTLITLVTYASVGISIFIVDLLLEYNYQVIEPFLHKKKKRLTLIKSAVLILGIFVLTCGKEVYSLFSINGTPLFDISTTNILLVSIFAIFYYSSNRSKTKLVITAILCLLFVLCDGKHHLINIPYSTTVLGIIMFCLAGYGLRKNIKSHKVKAQGSIKRLAVQQSVWVTFLVVMCLPLIAIAIMGIINFEHLAYISKGVVSTLVSFGGGSAYLSVAENSFVDVGVFPFESNQFLHELMPVVQALPGSFLCKTLCGAGYYIGFNITGDVLSGYIFAFAGLGMGVAASCYIVYLVAYFYNKFENLEIFETLKKSIKPIVAGLLLSTCLSLFVSIGEVFAEVKWNNIVAIVLTLLLMGITRLVKWKTKIPNIILILASGLVTIGLLNLPIGG